MSDAADRAVAPTTVAAWARHLGCDPADVAVEALRRELTAGTLPECFSAAARAHPTATVRVDATAFTSSRLHDLAARAATVLAGHGVGPGDRVMLCAPTSPGFVVGYLAALHAGTTVVLANPGYTAHELRSLVRRSRTTLLLRDPTAPDPAADPTAGPTAGPASGASGAVQTLSLADLLEDAPAAKPAPPARLSEHDVALLAYTSGTTGTPKGVPLTHGMLLASIRAVMRAWRWSADDTLVHALPLFHQHGLGGLHATLLAGSNAVLLSAFDPRALVDAVERSAATVLFGVPSVYQRLLAMEPADLRPLRRLRLATSGSAPLAAASSEEFHARTGLVPLERYGLTESGLDVSNLYEGSRAPGTVGVPLPGVEARLFDGDGAPVAPGEEGEIALRGPQVFSGYLDDPEATRGAFWPGGWFRTGDLGRWDGEGRLTISGRLKDLVITGGMNVSPLEVEQVIEQMPGVREAGVAGVASARWGEEVTAWVVPQPSAEPTEAEVVAYCRERLAAFKCPKRVHLVAALPRNPMGKVVRSDLPGWAPDGG